jgi:hypothetical protein
LSRFLNLLTTLAERLRETGLEKLPSMAKTRFGSYELFVQMRKAPAIPIFELAMFEQV